MRGLKIIMTTPIADEDVITSPRTAIPIVSITKMIFAIDFSFEPMFLNNESSIIRFLRLIGLYHSSLELSIIYNRLVMLCVVELYENFS